MYTTVESHGKTYKVANGTFYHCDTADAVITALESARVSGERIRIWYGKDGKNWHEENDVTGTVGRSMGPVKIPLLIHSRRSMGGGGILTDCIVKLARTKDGKILYQSANFQQGSYKIVPAYSEGYAEAVDVDGATHAQFKKAGQAARWIAYMTGERFSK